MKCTVCSIWTRHLSLPKKKLHIPHFTRIGLTDLFEHSICLLHFQANGNFGWKKWQCKMPCVGGKWNICPIPSMYGTFTYIWLIIVENVGKYTIHGWYGCDIHYQLCQAPKAAEQQRRTFFLEDSFFGATALAMNIVLVQEVSDSKEMHAHTIVSGFSIHGSLETDWRSYHQTHDQETQWIGHIALF